jgi:hypothetical protein
MTIVFVVTFAFTINPSKGVNRRFTAIKWIENDMNKNIGNLSGRGFSVMGFPTSDKQPSGLFVWGIYVAKYFEKYINYNLSTLLFICFL